MGVVLNLPEWIGVRLQVHIGILVDDLVGCRDGASRV
jgi:hypothetical protein